MRSVKSIVKLLKPLLLEAIGEAEAAGTPLEIRTDGRAVVGLRGPVRAACDEARQR